MNPLDRSIALGPLGVSLGMRAHLPLLCTANAVQNA